jgi:hypothetical protein
VDVSDVVVVDFTTVELVASCRVVDVVLLVVGFAVVAVVVVGFTVVAVVLLEDADAAVVLLDAAVTMTTPVMPWLRWILQ